MDDKLIRLARKIKDLENEQKKISQIMDLEKYLFVNHDISAENEGSIRNIVNNFYEEVRDNNFKEKGKFDTLESRINEIKEDIQEICISIDQSLTDIRETSQRERDNHKREISTRFMAKDNEISQLRKENINLINQLQDLKNVINSVSKIKQEKGNDGKSAYEIACELGFQGTVEEWLKSLHGRDGQDIELRGLRAFRDAPKDNKMYARKNKKWVEVENYDDTEIREDIAELQEENETQVEQITALQIENTRLKATLPTTTGSGENITLDKTAEMEFVKPPLPRGNSEQVQYSGKNLLSSCTNFTETVSDVTLKAEDGIYSINGTSSARIDLDKEIEVEYTIKSGDYFHLGNQAINTLMTFSLKCTDNTIISGYGSSVNRIYDLSSYIGKTINKISFGIGNGSTINNSVFKPMIVNNVSTATVYEPYVGGQASPNPDYPQAITNVTGDVEVLVQNKNRMKLVFSNDTNKFANLDFEHTDSSFSLKGIANYTYKIFNFANNFKFEYGKNYSLSMNILGTNAGIQVQYRAFNSLNQLIYQLVLNSSNNYKVTKIFNSNDNIHHSSLTIENLVNGGTYDLSANLQLEENETATTYTPHKEQTLPLTLGNIELCKIGDYQDYIYKDNGKWYKYGAIGKVELNGTESGGWTLRETNTNTMRLTADGLSALNIVPYVSPYCNYFIGYASNAATSNIDVPCIAPRDNSSGFTVRFPVSLATTVNEFKSWLGINKPKVYYPLSTPTITEITDTTLISQLEAIAKAISYEEQTNISGSSAGANPMFNVEAYQSIKLVLAS